MSAPDRRSDDLDKVWDDRGLKAYGEFTDQPIKTGIKWTALTIGGAIAGVVVLIVVITMIAGLLSTGNAFFQAQQAKLTVKPRVTQATYGTDNALVNIAYFHNQCNDVLADEQNVINAKKQLSLDRQTLAQTTDPIAQQQAGTAVTQDVTQVTGTEDQLSNDVRDYDSKSATQTANPFKANNLPYRISVNPTTGELAGNVSCH